MRTSVDLFDSEFAAALDADPDEANASSGVHRTEIL